MKAFFLKHQRFYTPPYCYAVETMMKIEEDRRVNFPNGFRGYRLDNGLVASSVFFTESFIKDGKVFQFVRTSRWGLSLFTTPIPKYLIPVSHRKQKIYPDTFLFKVGKQVEMMSAFRSHEEKGQFELNNAEQFAPVFDRKANLIGLTVGLFCEKTLCIPIQALS